LPSPCSIFIFLSSRPGSDFANKEKTNVKWDYDLVRFRQGDRPTVRHLDLGGLFSLQGNPCNAYDLTEAFLTWAGF